MIAFRRTLRLCALPVFILALLVPAFAQSCLTADDMDAATRTALTTAAQRYFDMAARGDTASIQKNSIPSVASNFSGIEGAIRDQQPVLAGSQGTPRKPFLLKVEGTAPLDRAEFLCGVFGANGQTADSAVFVLNNLPPGTYAITTLDVASSKGAHTVSFVLQQIGSDWKVGGVYIKASQIGGHDGEWYAARAREYKSKNQMMNAWFYYVEARDLLAPVPFMSTRATDRLYDESQSARPDLPTADHPITLAATAKPPMPKQGEHFNGTAATSYQIIDMYPTVVGNDFDLVVKYRAADISDTGKCFQDNMSVIHSIVAKYPEFHDSFNGVVARAVAPSGQDYGSLLAMKDIK